MTHNYEWIFSAANNSKPSAAQLADWTKRDAENARCNSYDHAHPDSKPRTALTGWDRRTLNTEYVNWSPKYAEPGYTDTPAGILFANWNQVSRRVQDILERAGYSLEWEDEWTTCSDCGNAVRITADSYNWQASYWNPEDSGELFCQSCIDPESYLESLHNNTRQCATIHGIDPKDHGYVKLQGDLEAGWSGNDDPKAVYKQLRKSGEKRPLIFVLDYAAQFDIGFSVWAK